VNSPPLSTPFLSCPPLPFHIPSFLYVLSYSYPPDPYPSLPFPCPFSQLQNLRERLKFPSRSGRSPAANRFQVLFVTNPASDVHTPAKFTANSRRLVGNEVQINRKILHILTAERRAGR